VASWLQPWPAPRTVNEILHVLGRYGFAEWAAGCFHPRSQSVPAWPIRQLRHFDRLERAQPPSSGRLSSSLVRCLASPDLVGTEVATELGKLQPLWLPTRGNVRADRCLNSAHPFVSPICILTPMRLALVRSLRCTGNHVRRCSSW